MIFGPWLGAQAAWPLAGLPGRAYGTVVSPGLSGHALTAGALIIVHIMICAAPSDRPRAGARVQAIADVLQPAGALSQGVSR